MLKELHLNKELSVLREKINVFYSETHLWACQMSDIAKPVDVSPTMIKGVNELVGNNSAHVSLISDIILAQNNLGTWKQETAAHFWNLLLLKTPLSLLHYWKPLLTLLPHNPSNPSLLTNPSLFSLGHTSTPVRDVFIYCTPELTTPAHLRRHSSVVLRMGLEKKQAYLNHNSRHWASWANFFVYFFSIFLGSNMDISVGGPREQKRTL